jgi:hypothetical protein
MSHHPPVANGISACLIARSNRAQIFANVVLEAQNNTIGRADFYVTRNV